MNAINRVDDFLLRKVFTPVAHYIDYRWHYNNYTQARWVFSFETVCLFVNLACWFMMMAYTAAVLAIIYVLIALSLTYRIVLLAKASEAYERRPDILPKEAIMFQQPGWPAMMNFCLALFVSGTDLPMVIKHHLGPILGTIFIICALWQAWDCIACYLARVPKPPAKRKQQEQGIGFLTPVAVRN